MVKIMKINYLNTHTHTWREPKTYLLTVIATMLLAGGMLNGCKPEMAGLQGQIGFLYRNWYTENR
jgi:hypothetical protein